MYNVSELPDNITIDECWIHPVEETGDGTNYQLRSVESGLYLDATNVTITRNAIQGFTGTNKYSYGGGPGSIRLDAKAILITGGTGPYTIANNLLEGWGNNLFIGSSGFATKSATASSIRNTTATLSNVSGISVGTILAVQTAAIPWCQGTVESINGNSVTFTPLGASYDGGNSNTP